MYSMAPAHEGTAILPNVANHASSDSTLNTHLHGCEYFKFRTVKNLLIYGIGAQFHFNEVSAAMSYPGSVKFSSQDPF